MYESGAVPAVHCDPAADGRTRLMAPLNVKMTDGRAGRILPVDLNASHGREEAGNPQVSDRWEDCGRRISYKHRSKRSPAQNLLFYGQQLVRQIKKEKCSSVAILSDKLAAYLLPSSDSIREVETHTYTHTQRTMIIC